MTPKMEAAEYLSVQDREVYQLSHLDAPFRLPTGHRQRRRLPRFDDAEMINGQILCVDGGMLAHTPSYAQFLVAYGLQGS